jgi:hypothetical protein
VSSWALSARFARFMMVLSLACCLVLSLCIGTLLRAHAWRPAGAGAVLLAIATWLSVSWWHQLLRIRQLEQLVGARLQRIFR